MNRYIIILILFSIYFSAFGQNSSVLFNSANKYFESLEFEKSKILFDSAFNVAKVNKIPKTEYFREYYNATYPYAASNSYDTAFILLKKYFDNEWEHLEFMQKIILTDSKLDNLHSNIKWEMLLQRIDTLCEHKKSIFNYKLSEELKKMKNIDQIAANDVMDCWDKQGGKGGICSEIEHKYDSICSANTSRLIEMYEEFGFPERTLVGSDGANAACLILIHTTDTVILDKFLPIVKQMVDADEVRRSSFAYISDKISVKKKQKQKYGTQGDYNKNGEMIFYPIEDIENIDKIRVEVGLDALSEYAKLLGVKELPEGYINQKTTETDKKNKGF